ncbi:MAG: ribonuclease III [Bacteroidota bacterium]
MRKLLPPRSLKDKKLKDAIWAITSLKPNNLALYKLALQHSSSKVNAYSNERLEFLGDAVLSLIIGEFLFKKYPLKEEGFLTEIRARIVNRASLGSLAKKIGIDTLLCYQKSIIQKEGYKFIYGNALEALIGAVYLDKGYQCCCDFVLERLLHCYIDLEALIQTDTNYKSQLVTWASRNRKKIRFEIVNEQRVGRLREFTAQVVLGDKTAGQGQGNSKKQAEQAAAQAALVTLMPVNA